VRFLDVRFDDVMTVSADAEADLGSRQPPVAVATRRIGRF
jgi:hypothetical protein